MLSYVHHSLNGDIRYGLSEQDGLFRKVSEYDEERVRFGYECLICKSPILKLDGIHFVQSAIAGINIELSLSKILETAFYFEIIAFAVAASKEKRRYNGED